MLIRHLQAQDLPSAQKLWTSCFEQEHEPFFQWFFTNRYQPDNALGLFQGDQLLSALHIAPYTLALRGGEMSAGYLMGVGTFPDYRQRGHMTALLKAALADMRRRGQWVSVLLPRRPGIYARHGWNICYYTHRYFIPAGVVRAQLSPGPARAAGLKDMAQLDYIYRQFMLPYHGYVCRDRRHWQELITENDSEQGRLFLLEGEADQGYLMFARIENKLVIKEMAYTSGSARNKLLGLAGHHAGDGDWMEWHLPTADPAFLDFADERKSITLYPHSSGRIVDVLRTLGNCPAPAGVTGSVGIAIEDPLADWNDGVFQVSASQGRLTVTQGGCPDVQMSIGAFSQLFFGAGLYELLSLGRLEVYQSDKLSLLCNLFTRQNTAIAENF